MAVRLAVLPNWLGDLVMAEPALRLWGSGHTSIAVVGPVLADLLRDAALVDHVEVFDRRGRDRGLWGLWRRGRELARLHVEEALVLGPSLRGAALAALSGARRRVGFGGEGRELLLTEVPPRRADPRDSYLAHQWLELVRPEGSARRVPERPLWKVGPLGREGLRSLSNSFERFGADEGFAVYAAGASYGSAKQWDGERFVAVARQVALQRGWTPVFVGGPAQAERDRATALAQASGGLSLAGHTDLPTLAAVLDRAELFVGNDSGPMHLSAALGTPTVGIFGSTRPAWTAPRGPLARTVGPAPVSCSPCYLRECPYARECFTGIGATDVLAAVDDLLGPGPVNGEVARAW